MKQIKFVDATNPQSWIHLLSQAISTNKFAIFPVIPDHPKSDSVEVPEEVSVVLETSGSVGRPKIVGISANNLLSSAHLTAKYFGSLGSWILALSPHHIAGLQVLVRSLVADKSPKYLPLTNFGPATLNQYLSSSFTKNKIAEFISLVPTQLKRCLNDPDSIKVLSTFQAVLVGGEKVTDNILKTLHIAGVNAVETYGMTETAGGCVYNGECLPGVQVFVNKSQRISITGPNVALGYLGCVERSHGQNFDASPRNLNLSQNTYFLQDSKRKTNRITLRLTDAFSYSVSEDVNTFHTQDLGVIDPKLRILGRADDAITTGGITFHPQVVEDAITDIFSHHPLLRGSEYCLVGVPNTSWGEQTVLAVTPSSKLSSEPKNISSSTLELDLVLNHNSIYSPSRPEDSTHILEIVKKYLSDSSSISPYCYPKLVVFLDHLEYLPSGKLDRRQVKKMVAQLIL